MIGKFLHSNKMITKQKGNIAVLYTKVAKCNTEKIQEKRQWKVVNSIFSKIARKHGLRLFFAYHKEYKNGKLKRAWYHNKHKWIKVKNQEIDLVYSRFARSMFKKNKIHKRAIDFKLKMADEVSIINHPAIDEFCWDKKIVPEILPKHTPKTYLVNTLHGLKLILPNLKTKKIVIKPRYGTLGKDVIITDKDNLPKTIKKNTIIQEFIDTSKGIDGVTNGMHDMRVFMANGHVDHAFVRIPKKGLLTANVALGGKKVFIDKKEIPKRAIRVAKKVDKLFKDFYPRVYSVDFLFNKKGKPYIVECNSQPMIDKYAFGKYADLSFFDRLCKIMEQGIKVKVLETI